MSLGIQNIKEVMDFAITLAESLSLSLEDGQFDPTDVVNFIPTLQKVIPAFDEIGMVDDEFLDITDEEKEELVEYLQSNLDIADDTVEAFIEAAFATALELFKFISMFFLNNDSNEQESENDQ